MAEEGGVNPTSGPGGMDDPQSIPPKPFNSDSRKSTISKSQFDVNTTAYGGTSTPMGSQRESIDLTNYFVGPRDMDRHSKLPYFMRMHGSVLPRMILPLFFAATWATVITVISENIIKISIQSTLLTVLGFVIGLALSFRTSTAYERYSDGRKSWTTLSVQCRNLARYIWIHAIEREGEDGKNDLLGKITAMNLILAFTVSLKHKLRFEPFGHYPDLQSLISHLDTFAGAASEMFMEPEKQKTPWKRVGEYLGVDFAASNPRKALKRAKNANTPVGNLPLEILSYLGAYIEEITANGTMKQAVVVGQMLICLATLTDASAHAERVLTTPLPIGYNILISQIVLIYIYLLPFQLVGTLHWVTIPGVVAAAYIIMGLAAIGNELENPFGNDVNDLPLDAYCEELSQELNILMSAKPPKFADFLRQSPNNQVLWPLSTSGYDEWKDRSEADIRSALRAKVLTGRTLPRTESETPRPKTSGSRV